MLAGKRYAIYEQPDSFYLPLFQQMPLTWVQQLSEAANEVNEELVIQLIEQISESSAALAETLSELIDNFRLDRIVHLTKLITESS